MYCTMDCWSASRRDHPTRGFVQHVEGLVLERINATKRRSQSSVQFRVCAMGDVVTIQLGDDLNG